MHAVPTMMAANSGTSAETPKGESEQPILKRHLTEERMDAECKWIYDLAMEVCQWLSQILDVKITPENYIDKLDTGVELCKLQNILVAGGEEASINYNANAKKNSMHARQNITLFTEWCKGFINKDRVFESNDLIYHKNELKCQTRVLSCLNKVKKRYASDTNIPDRSHNESYAINSYMYGVLYPLMCLCIIPLAVLCGGYCFLKEYFYQLVFLCLIALVVLGGFYILGGYYFVRQYYYLLEFLCPVAFVLGVFYFLKK